MQVSEKATGDLLVFIFVKFLLSFHKFVKVKVFLPLSELFSYIKCSSWKGSEGIESTRQICSVSTSEIKAEKEQFDHEVRRSSLPRHHQSNNECSSLTSWGWSVEEMPAYYSRWEGKDTKESTDFEFAQKTSKEGTGFELSWIFRKGSSWKGSEGIESTRKMWLVSNSEIKAGKEQFDHELYFSQNEMIFIGLYAVASFLLILFIS